ncbi:hypothetical protein DXG01_008438 [Tephrocybe rancida]|nr:hypothetical protein DXG01_008438 [Tephrocybe rancida]
MSLKSQNLPMAPTDLFPAPTASRVSGAPRTWPGITPQSTDTTQRIIKDSHEKWHVFFMRDYRPHKVTAFIEFNSHSVHHTLALWALGADDEIINASYNDDCVYLLPRFNSPGNITAKNFNEHLGDDEYYGAYLDYFTGIAEKQGITDAVEEYVFSRQANFIAGRKDDEQPQMLNRFLDGIIHSMIHVGYGLEFGVPGLVAEGLAWTAVHLNSASGVIPASLWKPAMPVPASLTSSLRNIDLGGNGASTVQQANTHAFTVLARILKDSRFDDIPAADDYTVVFSNIDSKYGDAIREYVHSWTYDQKSPDEVERKIEELVYANALIYAVSGWSKDDHFNTDFFHVHLVTSALFLSTIANILKPASQELLLRSFFAVCLTWWIGRGRPGLDLEGFYKETSVNPGPVDGHPAPRKDALPKPDSPKASNPNPWFQIIQNALVIPDDHFPKAIRSLAHYSEIYGGRKAGRDDFATTELPGAGLIDGTLFIRAAVLTDSGLRRDKDVDLSLSKYWERKGFYKGAPPAPFTILARFKPHAN